MPRHAWEVEINDETPREDLEWCVIAAERTSDSNAVKAAARARAELWRREQEAWAERLNFESKERVKAQRFQEAQMAKQIESQNRLMGQQLDIAKSAAGAAKISAWAATALVIVTAILAGTELATLLLE